MVTTRKTKATATSSSHRRPPQNPESPVKTFFKMVLPSTMKKNMMRIPPIFVKLQGSKLPEIVTLETPVGLKRSIKLKRIGQEIWFHEGWIEFAEAHSIEKGYRLSFEYNENSSFRVIIFNLSACEIEYPLDAVHNCDGDSDDDIIEITEHNPKKSPRDIEFDKLLDDLDSILTLKEEEEEEEEGEDKRVFRGY